jgi:NAD(P)-dependent dehydrogenase (short-subunit alcohol dehydrogenase family)
MKKSIVVTGAGQGIGKAIAMLLAEQDYSLLLLGRNLTSLEGTQASLKNPQAHKIFSCDVRQPYEIGKALTQSGIQSLYAVVANAGKGGENYYSEEDSWQEIIDTNLTGSYFTIQECLPFLKKNPDSYKKIVIISSILARLGVPGYSAYCASKAGLLGLMRSLAAELTADKILVNAICPGWVNTAMANEGLDGFADALNISREEAYKQAMAQVPLGKMSEPEEVAHLVSFLISGLQTSFTGQTFDINNGALMP